ncbi:MAG TPA: PDZ domain-containing protein [Thermoanaerobaculaceae bacterium]|nr:PDZ domain-containing protein [Thermoanaerobaculaceae bacterium]
MNTHGLIAVLGAALLAAAVPVLAQEDDSKARKDAEKQMHQAEEQMHQAERQMRDAERQMRDAARAMARLQTGKAMARVHNKVVVFGNRPRLGVVLKHESDPATDSVGAVVEALTPGGPAADAGLLAGDIITKFNGETLVGAKVDADEDESAPSARLIELARNLKEGEKVSVEYRRGSETHTTTVTASRLSGPGVRVFAVPGEAGGPEVEIPDVPEIPDININLDMLDGRPWCDLEMVALNPDLGEYFGTKEGVLVVRAPKDAGIDLKAGDVITSIGGRTPSTPSQTLRILRSYEPGESVTVELVRNKQKAKITLTMPAKKMGLLPEWTGSRPLLAPRAPVAPEAPETPLAPAAPAAPMAMAAPVAPAAPAPPPPARPGHRI